MQFQSIFLKIYAGSNRSYIIFEDSVLTWGQIIYFEKQSSGQDQNNDTKCYNVIPIKVNALSVGKKHTFAYNTVNKNNPSNRQIDKNQFSSHIQNGSRVYCWGSNQNYELGLEEETYYPLVNVDLFNEAFETGMLLNQISCGGNHTLAIFKQEKQEQAIVFGWGQSKSYQLALDTTSIVPYPVEISCQFPDSINSIISKSDYNIAILKNGDIYSWGCNIFNRLGLNENIKIEKQFPITHRDKNFPDKPQQNILSMTSRHLVQNKKSKILKLKIPKKISSISEKILKVALGTHHAIAISQAGDCYSWGNGLCGQLGNNKYEQSSPSLITKRHLPQELIFISCCAGEQFSALLDKNGFVYTCGSNSFGVLGHKKHENQTRKKRCKVFEKVDFLQDQHKVITSMVCGDHHIICLTSEGQLYGWGSNTKNQLNFCLIQSQSIALKPQQTQIKQSLQEYQDLSLKQLPQIELDALNITPALREWTKRYRNFLTQKRVEEDQLLLELEQKIASLSNR